MDVIPHLWICVPLYNRGRDVTLLLKNLEDIHNQSKLDPNRINFSVIISDFHSIDINHEEIKDRYSYEIIFLQTEGTFNIAVSLQKCFDYITNINDILLTCDADTVFESPDVFKDILMSVKKGLTFWCPIVSTQAKPSWSAEYNGRFYIPQMDHGGSGMIGIYVSDMKDFGGYTGSEFLGARGTHWGWHDTFLTNGLRAKLNWIRNIEPRVWLRWHERPTETEWFKLNKGYW